MVSLSKFDFSGSIQLIYIELPKHKKLTMPALSPTMTKVQ
jgi:hypothetical protein